MGLYYIILYYIILYYIILYYIILYYIILYYIILYYIILIVPFNYVCLMGIFIVLLYRLHASEAYLLALPVRARGKASHVYISQHNIHRPFLW